MLSFFLFYYFLEFLAGIVETLIEDMKRCHAKLSAESLLPVNKRNRKKVNLTFIIQNLLQLRSSNFLKGRYVRLQKWLIIILPDLPSDKGGKCVTCKDLWIQTNSMAETMTKTIPLTKRKHFFFHFIFGSNFKVNKKFSSKRITKSSCNNVPFLCGISYP